MHKQFSASLLSASILSLSLGVLWLGHYLTSADSETLIVRKLDVAITPPPPPPPKNQQVVQQADITMQVEGSGVQMEMANIEIDPNIEITKPDMPTVQVQQTQWKVPEVDWDAYGLGDLDDKPSLLTPVKIHFPQKLRHRGITKVVVKLDVMIDEQGDVTLIDIVENPYHELNREIQRFVKGSKFTAPHKASEAVRARFIWPIEIEA